LPSRQHANTILPVQSKKPVKPVQRTVSSNLAKSINNNNDDNDDGSDHGDNDNSNNNKNKNKNNNDKNKIKNENAKLIRHIQSDAHYIPSNSRNIATHNESASPTNDSKKNTSKIGKSFGNLMRRWTSKENVNNDSKATSPKSNNEDNNGSDVINVDNDSIGKDKNNKNDKNDKNDKNKPLKSKIKMEEIDVIFDRNGTIKIKCDPQISTNDLILAVLQHQGIEENMAHLFSLCIQDNDRVISLEDNKPIQSLPKLKKSLKLKNPKIACIVKDE